MANSSFKKILVVRFSSIGDIVLCSAATRCLKNQYPSAEIHFATKKAYAELAGALPGVEKVHSLGPRFAPFIQSLKNEHFDLIIDLHNNLRSARLKLNLGVKSLSFNKENLQKWKMVRFKSSDQVSHVALRYVEAMDSIGVKYDGKGLNLDLPKDLSVPLIEAEFIAVAVGAKFKTKQIPESVLVEILKGIGKPIALLGGPEDAKAGDAIFDTLDGQKVLNYCGKLSILESAGMIRQADLVLSGDTGLMHIAAALKKRVVCLWGNTVPGLGMYPFYPTDQKDLAKNFEVGGLSCRPCSKIGFDSCPKGHFNCMMKQDTNAIRMVILQQSTRP